jgi:16S rRNA (uracil1498-N3)-methyltransferase
MKRLLCERLPKPNRPTDLSESEAHHAVRVLRLRDGEKVEALDGNGNAATVLLRTRGGPPRIEFDDSAADGPSKTGLTRQKPSPLTLEMAVLKGDAMEWVIEKAVELGVRTLIPVLTDFTVVQVKAKGPETFQARWQKIADQALKQCGRLEKMLVELPLELERLLASPSDGTKIARAWCDEVAPRENVAELSQWLASPRAIAAERIHLLIGPEGGWSPKERELLGSPAGRFTERVSLGELVLRAETAALFGVSLASSALRARSKSTPAAIKPA